MARVAHLWSSPVKGLPTRRQDRLVLDAAGIVADRRFVLVGEDDRVLYGADVPQLAGAEASWLDPELAITFADRVGVTGQVVVGATVAGRAYGDRAVPGELVDGPFADALSARIGRPVRLARVPVGLGSPGPVTLISLASVARVAEALGVASLDSRRFKMNVEIDGIAAHEEDSWEGQDVRIGSAVLRVGGPVPRCVLTTRDPDTQQRDHDTLRAILSYREPMDRGEPPLGVYATVVTPGVIETGDTVEVVR
jgi:uncharacterized protein YcbX